MPHRIPDRELDEFLVMANESLQQVRYDYFWLATRFYKAAGQTSVGEWQAVLNKLMEVRPDEHYVAQSYMHFQLEPLKFCSEHYNGRDIFEMLLHIKNPKLNNTEHTLNTAIDLIRRVKREKNQQRMDELEAVRKTLRE